MPKIHLKAIKRSIPFISASGYKIYLEPIVYLDESLEIARKPNLNLKGVYPLLVSDKVLVINNRPRFLQSQFVRFKTGERTHLSIFLLKPGSYEIRHFHNSSILEVQDGGEVILHPNY